MIYDIGIVDTKKIIATINDIYGYDFSNFALTALKRRILKVLNDNNYSSIVDFISNIEKNKSLFEKYLSEGLIDTTEMFRDPSAWRDLRDKHLPFIFKNRSFKVLIPGITSGEDLYTALIVMKEAGVLNYAKVTATSMSDFRIDQIKDGGKYDLKKVEISEANYKRFTENRELSDYFTIEGTKAVMNTDLLENVTFKKHTLFKDDLSEGCQLIIYRNRLIYFNAKLMDEVVKKLVKILNIGGILAIGSKETLENTSSFNKLLVLNKDEQIYKKRID